MVNRRHTIFFYVVIGLTAWLAISLYDGIANSHQALEDKPRQLHSKNLFNKDRRPNAGNRSEINPDEVGITENLGHYIPLNTRFTDENGNPLTLSGFIDRPTLIVPVFYRCPQSCPILLSNLAGALNEVGLKPGKEYKVITLSMDDQETPKDALEARKNYLRTLRNDFPMEDWKFLTGNKENVQAVTDALGFKFKKIDERNFVHPNVLICVAADGKIIRYLHGTYMLPFDISMSIAEAEKGTPGLSIKKLASYCFAYDPVGKKYVFKTFRITGIAILSVLGIFLFFLLRKRKDQH